MRRLFLAAVLGLFVNYSSSRAQMPVQRVELGWPTPSTAYFEGKPLESFIQPTASGVLESGLFGCRRSGGAQFHEGVDLKPVKRERGGEPADPIFAVLPGVVRHINRTAGDSSYGRYIVIEHPEMTPAVYTLYAHLARVEPGLRTGVSVERGQTIGTMGRSSSGAAIPKDRAHLHFEIGVWLTREFQSWYNWKKFGSANDHSFYNGMNLAGLDPLDFYDQLRARRVDGFQDYFSRMKPAVRVRVATRKIPDFTQRYPSLLAKPFPVDGVIGGWEVAFNENGLPFAWTPLTPMEMLGSAPGDVRVVSADEALLKQHRCRSLTFTKRGRLVVGKDLESTLQLLFGLRAEL